MLRSTVVYTPSLLSWVDQYIRERSLGGPGSGNHGHAGRPGKEGGSAPGGSSSKEGPLPVIDESTGEGEMTFEEIMEWLNKSTKKRSNSTFEPISPDSPHYERVMKVVNGTATRMKFPTDRILVTEEKGYGFNLDGENYYAAGDYDPTNDRIRLFDVGNATNEELRGYLTHEIAHHRYKIYKDAYTYQMKEITRIADQEPDWKNWPIRADGELRPGNERTFWAYGIHQKYFSGKRWEALKKADGVSSYSTEYWEQAVKTGRAEDYDMAVNETLAEIARIGTSPKPEWSTLYKEIRREARLY